MPTMSRRLANFKRDRVAVHWTYSSVGRVNDKGIRGMSMDDITLEEHFVRLAKHFRAKARNEKGRLKAEWEHLANCYAEMHSGSDQNRAEESAR